MIAPGYPSNEKERLLALKEYQILDTLPEQEYDDITLLASEICQTPISTITFIDKDRQWFKSSVGPVDKEAPREITFCAYAVEDSSKPLIVNDSRVDVRFEGNPLVVGNPHVVFYAGFPLVNEDGLALGTLCVIDNKPRALSEKQYNALRSLASQVVIILELRRRNIELEQSKKELSDRYSELERFSNIISHDLKAPVNNIISIAGLLKTYHTSQLNAEGLEYIEYLADSGDRIKRLIDGLLSYYKGSTLAQDKRGPVVIPELLTNIISLVNGKNEIQFIIPTDNVEVYSNAVALQQIFLNLIVNAIKYNDKPEPKIEILHRELDNHHQFGVRDNGRGMEPGHLTVIFNLFTHLGQKDRDGNVGTGIGLATVKKLVERLGGEIDVTSIPGEGTTFFFTVKK